MARTEQMNIRLDDRTVEAIERVARAESLDRATALRRLLHSAIEAWEHRNALDRYRTGDLSAGAAAEMAGVSHWELIELARADEIAYPLRAEEIYGRLAQIRAVDRWPSRHRIAEDAGNTLPDRPARPGGILLVGINPAPTSVAAGHYYQGRIGRRLWRRLEGLGLLSDPVPGAEDDAFVAAGNGLTDLVKRPTVSANDLTDAELEAGIGELRSKVREWRPRLVLFAFAAAARSALGERVKAGPGPTLDGVPTFLMTGPYAPRAEAARNDEALRDLLGAG